MSGMVPPSSTLLVTDLLGSTVESEVSSWFDKVDGFRGARLRKDRKGAVICFVEFDAP